MTRTLTWRDEATAVVTARPEQVWLLVTDITRMGEWSPVCRRCEWLEGSEGADVGARFVGHNRQGLARWSRVCEITASEHGREFAFRTFFKGAEATRWGYRLDPGANATTVIESYEVVSMPRYVQLLHRLPGVHAKARRDGLRNMQTTLERLAAAAERTDS